MLISILELYSHVFSCIFKIKFIEMYNRAIVLLLKERKIITDLGVTN